MNVDGSTYPKNSGQGNWNDLAKFALQTKRQTTQTFVVDNCNTIDTIGGATKLNGTGIQSMFISTPCSSLTINIQFPKSTRSISSLPCVGLEVNDYKIITLEGNFYFNNTECVNLAAQSPTSPQDFESELLLKNIELVTLKLPKAGTIFYAYFKKTKGEIFPHFKLNPYGNYSKIVTQGEQDVIERINVPKNTQLVKRRTTLAYTYLKEDKKKLETRQRKKKNSPNGPFFFLGIFLITLLLCTSCVILTRPCHDKKYREDYTSYEDLDKKE